MTTIIALLISVAAFGLSVFTWRERRVNDKRDLFLRVHEQLVDQGLQRGRRFLRDEVTSSDEAMRMVRERYDDYVMICRAISMFDIAALYVEQGYINKELFISEWGNVYFELRANLLLLIAERAKDGRPHLWSWPHFKSLADEVHARWEIHNDLSPDLSPTAASACVLWGTEVRGA